jgi:hypothetical protein
LTSPCLDGLITSIDDLSLQIDDDIESICKTIRKPGGRAVGEPIAHTAETNCNSLQHLKHCSLTAIVGNLTLVNVHVLRSLRQQEDVHKEPDAPESDDKDWA